MRSAEVTGTHEASVAGKGRLTFETAAQHATALVPIVEPLQRIDDVRHRLIGRRYGSASHLVVCEDGQFRGVMTIEDVLAAPQEATVESVMDAESPSVGPGIDQEVAAWRAVQHQESALSVVDGAGRFIGIIPPHRLIEVLLSEHEEDLSRLGGFLRDTSTARRSSEEPAPRRFRHRLPWLLLGLSGALIAADLVGAFETQLQANILLAFFLPGIVYLADAVGTQTETIVVRGLSLGVPIGRMIARELVAGLAIGAALAAIAGSMVWWRWGSDVGLAIGLSVGTACSSATVAAMALPWLFDAFGLDPAFGSGPLATVIQDLLSIWLYLAITSRVIA
jgi:magnesium transporter